MGFNFGAAFSGFADSFVTGFEKGDTASEKRRLRKEKTRGPDSDAAARNKLAALKASGAASGDDLEVPEDTPVPAGQPTVPTAAPTPLPPAPPVRPAAIEGQYALGGPVAGTTDSVEQSNNEYYTQEAQRTQGETPSAMPQPAAIDTGEDGGADEGGNLITSTLNKLKNFGRDKSGAIPNTTQAQPNPYREFIDTSGRSYPDLTQFIGGIRQVTGAKANMPLTTTDHLRFLQLRMEEFIQRGGSMDEAMKFNAAYLDTARLQSQRTFALASAAWDQGDGKAVQFFVKQGWGLVPDGTTLKTAFKNGKLYTQQFDDKTGKPMGAMETLDKNSFLRRATDITGTTLSFGNHLLDMDEQRKQKYRAARTGSGSRASAGEAAPKGITGTAQTQLNAAFKNEKMSGDAALGTSMYRQLPGIGPAEVPKVLKGLRDNTLGFDPEGPKGPGIYTVVDGKAGDLVHKSTPEFGSVMPKPKPGSAGAAPTGQSGAAAPAGVPGITKAPGSGTSSEPQASAPNPQPPVVASSASSDGEPASALDRFRQMGRDLGNTIKNTIGAEPPNTAPTASAQPPVADREAIATNPQPPKKLDSRGREVRSIPDVVSEGVQRLRAYDVKNAEERDRGRALLLADVVRSGKATAAQKQAYQELRAKLGD